MPLRIFSKIPEALYDRLQRQAERSGTSMDSLILGAIKQIHNDSEKGKYVTGPLITGSGKLGHSFPHNETLTGLFFS